MPRILIALLAAGALAGQSLTDLYREPASRLIGAALSDGDGWEKLVHLCDRIGHRLSGSPQMMQSVRWAAETMRREGLENVQTPRVMVPHWVRGSESLELIEPGPHRVSLLGLGNSVGTPAEGITAEVVVVGSFEELEKLGAEKIRGRIVLYNAPFQGYGRTVAYRGSGASRAAKLGAVAALVRSVGPVSLRTPHTGALNYAEGAPRIPAVAVAIEDAERMQRLYTRGDRLVARLKMEARTLPDAEGANVMGEYRGREKPEEVVVLGGHFDSWDVGTGAHDDGAGCVAAWQAVALMKKLGLRPRRTVRVVLWANEENGLAGANAYRAGVGEAVKNHVAAIEMDGGAERPAGFGLGLSGVSEEVWMRALSRAQEIGALLEGLGAAEIWRGGGGADIGPLMRAGVPGLGHLTSGGHYFDWHHTEADTLDKVDPVEFRKNVAVLAVMAFVLADMPGRLTD